MYAADWIALAVVGVSLLLGAWRGLLYEAFSLGGWVLAYLAARFLAAPLGRILPVGDPDGSLRYLAAFALVFIVVAFASSMLASAARGTAKALGMRAADRVFGALFGVARGIFLLLLAAALVHLLGLDQESWWRDAWVSQGLHQGLLVLKPLLPEVLGQYISGAAPP